MGEYMKMLNTVKEYIYSKQVNNAKLELQKLLNVINTDMKESKNPQEQALRAGGFPHSARHNRGMG